MSGAHADTDDKVRNELALCLMILGQRRDALAAATGSAVADDSWWLTSTYVAGLDPADPRLVTIKQFAPNLPLRLGPRADQVIHDCAVGSVTDASAWLDRFADAVVADAAGESA